MTQPIPAPARVGIDRESMVPLADHRPSAARIQHVMTDVGIGTLPESSRKTGIPKQTLTPSRIVNVRHGITDRPARSRTLRGEQLLVSDHCPVLVTQQVVHLSVAVAAVLDPGRTNEAHGSPVKY